MGRVRTKTVKKASKVIIEKYYTKLTLDFDTNKKIIEEIALIPSKPLRNKIAGFVTHLMKRLEKSTVRGISIKLQVSVTSLKLSVRSELTDDMMWDFLGFGICYI